MGHNMCADKMVTVSLNETLRMTRTQLSHHVQATLHALGGFIVLLAITLLSGVVYAEDAPPAKVTYDDHVRPIFRQYCLSCHAADSRKGDLAIDAFATTIEGGASGEVVFGGDLESSRLWLLVNHEDEPKMPPEADKLPEDKLAVIRKWIEGGALENSGSVAKVKKKSGLAMMGPIKTGKPEGPAAMPESLLREPVVYSSRAAAVTSLAASPWAPLVAVTGQRQVSFYHTGNGSLLGVIPFLERNPQVVAFSRDGSRLMIAGGRAAAIGLAALYDVKTGSRLISAGDEYDSVLAADLNAKQTLFALGGPQKVVRVYEAADNSLAFEIRKHTDWITAIAFSPDGKLLFTADRSGGMFLWEAETGREVASLKGHSTEVTSVSWRPDSLVVATSGLDGTVRLWNPEEGKQIKSWAAHGGGATSISFAADGRLVSAGRDRIIKLWKGDGTHIKNLTTFGDIALAVCVTHDGKRVVAGDFSGEVRLLDLESGQQVALLPPNPPTLAMRTATAVTQLEAAIAAVNKAANAKQEADKALAPVKAETVKRAAAMAEMEKKLAEAKAAQAVAAKDATAKQQAVAATGEQVKQAAAAVLAATATMTAAEAELSQARTVAAAATADAAATTATAAAEAKLAAAAEQTKQMAASAATAQAALKAAAEASKAAAAVLAASSASVVEADKAVQAAEAAVAEYAPQLTAAEQKVAAAAQELAKRQAAVAAATEAATAAKAEQAAFAAASAKFSAAASAAEEKLAAETALFIAANAAKEKATSELSSRKAAADAAAKKLAAIKAEYEKLVAAMNESQTVASQKTEAAKAAELARLRAEAVAARAKADKEMFEESQAVRAKYNGK